MRESIRVAEEQLNSAAAGPLCGTTQTTGVRTDPVFGLTSQAPADLRRVYVEAPAGRAKLS
jgi:hypothetical protein